MSEKLDDSIFLLWRQQVEPCIKSHRLQHFVVNPSLTLQFLSETDWDSGTINPA